MHYICWKHFKLLWLSRGFQLYQLLAHLCWTEPKKRKNKSHFKGTLRHFLLLVALRSNVLISMLVVNMDVYNAGRSTYWVKHMDMEDRLQKPSCSWGITGWLYQLPFLWKAFSRAWGGLHQLGAIRSSLPLSSPQSKLVSSAKYSSSWQSQCTLSIFSRVLHCWTFQKVTICFHFSLMMFYLTCCCKKMNVECPGC